MKKLIGFLNILEVANSNNGLKMQASQQELQQSREDLRALAGQLLTAQEEDRRRLSRDLHDDINQRLAMLSMDLRQAEIAVAISEVAPLYLAASMVVPLTSGV